MLILKLNQRGCNFSPIGFDLAFQNDLAHQKYNVRKDTFYESANMSYIFSVVLTHKIQVKCKQNFAICKQSFYLQKQIWIGKQNFGFPCINIFSDSHYHISQIKKSQQISFTYSTVAIYLSLNLFSNQSVGTI